MVKSLQRWTTCGGAAAGFSAGLTLGPGGAVVCGILGGLVGIMGGGILSETAEFLEAEQKTWVEHILRFDEECRSENLRTMEHGAMFQNGAELRLGFVEHSMANVTYEHWFVTDVNGRTFLEFGAPNLDIYKARVQINTCARDVTLHREGGRIAKVTMDEDVRQRIKHVLGLKNYSLCLRNCEHVARYIVQGKWTSVQMSQTGGLLGWFKDYMMQNDNRKVNAFPSCLQPHRMTESCNTWVYGSRTNTWYRPWFSLEGISYYLDDQEDTVNIAVFGPSGSGKSRLINMMFNRQICDTKVSLNSVTRDIHFIRGRGLFARQVRDVVVADTIGLCDTVFSAEETMAIIKDRISSNVTKLHAVYIVLSSKRCFEEFKTNLKNILKWLKYNEGDNKWFFRFVVTHCEGEDEGDLERIRGEARAVLGLESTTVPLVGGSELETMICCGFPNEGILNDAGKNGVMESMRRISTLIHLGVEHEGQMGHLDIPRQEEGWCNIL